MDIVERKLTELEPYENNPRKNEGAVDVLVASIRTFGFRVPLLITKDNVIISGHTRLKAAEKLGMESVPCLIVDSLSENDIRQFRIVDNKSAELAKWDFAALADELEDIPEINMDAFGFAAFDVDEQEPVEVTSSLGEGEEVDLEDFDDAKFDHKCPECGYVWNE